MPTRMNIFTHAVILSILFFSALACLAQAQNRVASSPHDAFLSLMVHARKHAQSHGDHYTPLLGPPDSTLLDVPPLIAIQAAHRSHFKIITATTNNPEMMRTLTKMRVDGIISDYPDVLGRVLEQEKARADDSEKEYFVRFDLEGHRGARGLRPENTLPAFEAGLDNGINAIETDIGVTSDGVSLISHDQFLNPQSCRRVDGSEYTRSNRVYIKDISMRKAQREFVCDKMYYGADQKNDLVLSPVAVAFARTEDLINPFVPTYAEQMFRFIKYYGWYYKSGPGKNDPDAKKRSMTAEKVRFDIETKITPLSPSESEARDGNHTDGPEVFVKTLCGAISKSHMEKRTYVQSRDYRVLLLIQEQYKNIQTLYLTSASGVFYLPSALRSQEN